MPTSTILNDVKGLANELKEAVTSAIEANDIRSGQITLSILEEKLNAVERRLCDEIATNVQAKAKIQHTACLGRCERLEESTELNVYKAYSYSVKGSQIHFWHVPKGFEFPQKANIYQCFEFWVRGMPGYEVVNEDSNVVPAPVRPFRKIELKFIPEAAQRNRFRQHWRTVFKFFEEALNSASLTEMTSNLSRTETTSNLSSKTLKELFEKGMNSLKDHASYVFANPKREPTSWTIAYWSKMLSRSMIEKHGNSNDISKLAAPKRRNASHPLFMRCKKVQRIDNEQNPKDGESKQRIDNEQNPKDGESKPAKSSPVIPLQNQLDDDDDETDHVTTLASLGIGGRAERELVVLTFCDSPIPSDVGNENLSSGIRVRHRDDLLRQGSMLGSDVIRAYFFTLARQFYSVGVRSVDDFFYPMVKCEIRTSPDTFWEVMKRKYRKAELDSAKLLLMPIFTGVTTGGHFSLVILDRTVYRPGIFFYF